MNNNILKKLGRLTPIYWATSVSELHSEQKLNRLLRFAKKTCPFYSVVGNGKSKITLLDFPIIRKKDIVGKEGLFVPKHYPRRFLRHISTGGTSGLSLNIHQSIFDSIKENRFVNHAHGLITPWYNKRVAVLRGNKPQDGNFSYSGGTLTLSSYDLNMSTAIKYMQLLNHFKATTLHVYPSAMLLFCKYLLESRQKILLPHLKGILSSSEVLSFQDKRTILNTFPNITLIDLYGQNEHVAFALSKNYEPYKFYNSYGFVELLDTGQKQDENSICEIVGTGFINKAMPLIRYATEDYVAVSPEGRIVSILGRSQDFVVNKNGDVVICMLHNRDNALKNVMGFQYYQDTPGIVEFNVVVNENFCERDKKIIEEDFYLTYGELVQGKVVVVNELIRTPAGKQIRLIQKLRNIEPWNNTAC